MNLRIEVDFAVIAENEGAVRQTLAVRLSRSDSVSFVNARRMSEQISHRERAHEVVRVEASRPRFNPWSAM